MAEGPNRGIEKLEIPADHNSNFEDYARRQARLLVEAGVAEDEGKLAAYLQDQDPRLQAYPLVVINLIDQAGWGAFFVKDDTAEDLLGSLTAETYPSTSESIARLRCLAVVYRHFTGNDPRPALERALLEEMTLEAERMGLEPPTNLRIYPEVDVEAALQVFKRKLAAHQESVGARLESRFLSAGMPPKLAESRTVEMMRQKNEAVESQAKAYLEIDLKFTVEMEKLLKDPELKDPKKLADLILGSF